MISESETVNYMKKNFTKSLRFQLTAISAALVLGISVLLAVHYIGTVNVMYDETYNAMQTTTSLYSKQLTDQLKTAELYLINCINENSDINTIQKNDRRSTDWNTAVYRIQNKFSTDRSIYATDGFFLYLPDTGLFVYSGTPPKTEIQASLNSAGWSSNKGKWILIASGSSNYIYRAIRIGECYIGAYAGTETLLEGLSDDSSAGRFHFAEDDGSLLSDGPRPELTPFPEGTDKGYLFAELDNSRHMLVYQTLSFSDLYLTALIPSADLEHSVQMYFPYAVFLMIAVAAFLMMFIFAMRRLVFLPLRRLSNTIEDIRQGDLDSTVDDGQSCSEFIAVNQAFNKMIAEIQTLKIDIYEEQLTRKGVEIDYLRQQIAPHFLINCLNTIYQLNDTENRALAQEMAKELSCHIRYTLSSGETVPLSLELEHTKNYVELSNIRYHNSIRLQTDIDPDTLTCRVIPLLLLNFVENTIKYEVTVGKTIHIYIGAKKLLSEGRAYVDLLIWDSGAGFSGEILQKLQDIDGFIQEFRGRHVGIINVFMRLQMLLGDCTLRFSNREDAGAQIEMRIPYREYDGKENRRNESADRG